MNPYMVFDLENNARDLTEDLRASRMKVGRLYPVLQDFYGNVIDGNHRLKADREWPTIRLKNVKTERDRIIIRLIANMCRRITPAKEKSETLGKLGAILLEEGVKPGEISKKIAEETGMSYRWVMKYLPAVYKDELQSERRSKIDICQATKVIHALSELWKPPRKKLLEINNYANTEFAIYMVKRSLHEKIQRIAEKMRITPDILVQNILEEKLREVETYTLASYLQVNR